MTVWKRRKGRYLSIFYVVAFLMAGALFGALWWLLLPAVVGLSVLIAAGIGHAFGEV